MPSFLSKVFGRKKETTETKRASNASLLDGKFEAVAASPSADKFPAKDVPHLALDLPSTKEETFEPEHLENKRVDLNGRTLNVAETLELVQACSTAIHAHGLETLGLMRPNWYSASPAAQTRLIGRFLSKSDDFLTDIDQSSPHDVSAVLRWALRHLKLENDNFGKSDDWYAKFHDAEKNAKYPARAYSDHLLPLVPESNQGLLTVVLDLTSSLSAHSEVNGVSGSKFSRLIGLWLLTARRVEPNESWSSFYARWDRTGRILEHLFLARIRDEASRSPLPRRLTELVAAYPYAKSASPNDTLLPKPIFSTRTHKAIFLRVETESSTPGKETAFTPAQIVQAGFAASVEQPGEWQQIREFAQEPVSAAANGNEDKTRSTVKYFYDRVLTDEYLELLKLRSSSAPTHAPSNSVSLVPTNGAISANKRRSFSVSSDTPTLHSRTPSGTADGNAVGLDWSQFSSSGFFGAESPGSGSKLAATLLDKDIEVTTPTPSKSGLGRSVSKRGRKSHDSSRQTPTMTPLTITPSATKADVTSVPAVKEGKVTSTASIELDEAFIDFWADVLVDPSSIPTSPPLPNFVLAKLAPTAIPISTPTVEGNMLGPDKKLEYLIIEHAFVSPPPPPAPVVKDDTNSVVSRSTSPSRKTSESGKKRFSMFSSSSMGSRKTSKKDKSGGPAVGEMGEILEEIKKDKKDKELLKAEKEAKLAENSKVTPSPEPSANKTEEVGKKEPENGHTGAVVAGAAGVVAVGAGAVAATALSGDEEDVVKEDSPEDKSEAPVVFPGGGSDDDEPVPVTDDEEPVPVTDDEESAAVPVTEEPAVVPATEETDEDLTHIASPEQLQSVPSEEPKPIPPPILMQEPEPTPAVAEDEVPFEKEESLEPAPLLEASPEPEEEPEVQVYSPPTPVQELEPPVVEEAEPEPPSPSPIEEPLAEEEVAPVDELAVAEEEAPPSPVEELAPPPAIEDPAIVEESEPEEVSPPTPVEALAPSAIEEPVVEEEVAPVERVDTPPTIEEPLVEEEPSPLEEEAPVEAPVVVEEAAPEEVAPPTPVEEPVVVEDVEPEEEISTLTPIDEPVIEEEEPSPAEEARPASPPALVEDLAPSPTIEAPVVEDDEPPVEEDVPPPAVEEEEPLPATEEAQASSPLVDESEPSPAAVEEPIADELPTESIAASPDVVEDVQPTVEAEDTYLEGHHEPLREPSPAPADPTDLEPIPVVDAAPPLVETAHPVSAAGEITPPIEHVDEENEDPTPISAATEEVHSSGKIPSAQVMLDAAVDENTEATDEAAKAA